MDNKKLWEDFTKSEQTILLNHWVYYYGGIVMTLKDLEDFNTLSETRQDDIFNHIVTCFIYKRSIQSSMLIMCLRDNKIEDLFNTSLSIDNIEDSKKDLYYKARRIISNELLDTFINPELSNTGVEIIIEETPQKHM